MGTVAYAAYHPAPSSAPPGATLPRLPRPDHHGADAASRVGIFLWLAARHSGSGLAVPWGQGKPTMTRFARAHSRQEAHVTSSRYVAGQVITLRPSGVVVSALVPSCASKTTTTGPTFNAASVSASASVSALRLTTNPLVFASAIA